MKKKLLLFTDLVAKVAELRASGKTVVQSHGVFDIIHPGVIEHLQSAKNQGGALVVTVINDRDVRKGPGRPIFSEDMRVMNVSNLEMVDYVCLVSDETPFECVKQIKPTLFAKGISYKERDHEIQSMIQAVEEEFNHERTKIIETEGFTFSSSHFINNFLNVYPQETQHFLEGFKKKYDFQAVLEGINNLKNQRVLLIGDGIIDEYHFCSSMARASKSNIVVNKYLTHEVYAGGAFAIANHVAGLCDKVHMVTALGNQDSREVFIRESLRSNITTKLFFRDDAPSTIKKRYLDRYLNQKIFEVNYINDFPIEGELEQSVVRYLEAVMDDYDLFLVSDFGHGFITKKIIDTLSAHSKKIAVNTQTNAANSGYNLITKYKNPFFVCLDEPEIRLASQERFLDIEEVARTIKKETNASNLIVTLGKRGSIAINNSGHGAMTPIFSTKVIDTVGAGDAFFAFTAPCVMQGMPIDLVGFIGNIAGAIAVQIIGNKKPVGKFEFLELASTVLK